MSLNQESESTARINGAMDDLRSVCETDRHFVFRVLSEIVGGSSHANTGLTFEQYGKALKALGVLVIDTNFKHFVDSNSTWEQAYQFQDKQNDSVKYGSVFMCGDTAYQIGDVRGGVIEFSSQQVRSRSNIQIGHSRRRGRLVQDGPVPQAALAPAVDATEDDTTEDEATEHEAPAVEAPEAEVPEGEAPAAEVPEGEVPEAEVPEAEVPEGEAPAAEVPEGEVPEAEVPEGEVQEDEAQEDEAPAVQAPPPEVAPPEVAPPEVAPPEVPPPAEVPPPPEVAPPAEVPPPAAEEADEAQDRRDQERRLGKRRAPDSQTRTDVVRQRLTTSTRSTTSAARDMLRLTQVASGNNGQPSSGAALSTRSQNDSAEQSNTRETQVGVPDVGLQSAVSGNTQGIRQVALSLIRHSIVPDQGSSSGPNDSHTGTQVTVNEGPVSSRARTETIVEGALLAFVHQFELPEEQKQLAKQMLVTHHRGGHLRSAGMLYAQQEYNQLTGQGAGARIGQFNPYNAGQNVGDYDAYEQMEGLLCSEFTGEFGSRVDDIEFYLLVRNVMEKEEIGQREVLLGLLSHSYTLQGGEAAFGGLTFEDVLQTKVFENRRKRQRRKLQRGCRLFQLFELLGPIGLVLSSSEVQWSQLLVQLKKEVWDEFRFRLDTAVTYSSASARASRIASASTSE